jgi:hypothetical protein
LAAALAVQGCLGCSTGVIPLRPELRQAAAGHDALALSDAVEKLIDERRITPEDREAAYDAVREWPQPTAGYAYARANLVGRLAQIRGMTGALLIAEMEKWARQSVGLNPKFRNSAAKRMLGTLYVLAPASLLKHGDSEKGLELLHEVVEAFPDEPENHLRLAEAYASLGDPEPALESLCFAIANRKRLRPDSQRLLARVRDEYGKNDDLDCGASEGKPQPSGEPSAAPPPPSAEPAPKGTEGGGGAAN